jgi:hypothetical protein
MKDRSIQKTQKVLEAVSRRWWFSLLIFILLFIPSFTEKPHDSRDAAQVVIAVLSHAQIYLLKAAFPLFKLLPLLLLVLLLVFKNRFSRLFSLYVSINFLLVAVLQNTAYTGQYGFTVLIGNVIYSLLIALSWLWESIIQKTDYSTVQTGFRRYWTIPLALLAFWFPIHPETLQPDFNPLYLITSEAGLTFCMLVPIYLTILLLYYPRVNPVTLRITSLAGFFIAIMNVVQFFILNKGLVWMGILHLPQFFIALYGLILSSRLLKVSAKPAADSSTAIV